MVSLSIGHIITCKKKPLIASLHISLDVIESPSAESSVTEKSSVCSQQKMSQSDCTTPTSSKRLHRLSGHCYSPAKSSPSVTVSG